MSQALFNRGSLLASGWRLGLIKVRLSNISHAFFILSFPSHSQYLLFQLPNFVLSMLEIILLIFNLFLQVVTSLLPLIATSFFPLHLDEHLFLVHKFIFKLLLSLNELIFQG